jgi:hypothetical protein
MTIEITNQVRIQKHQDFWYTVEDTYLDVGSDGCTISYWEFDKEKGDKRIRHICMGKEESLAIASVIYKLFGDNK